MTIGVQLLEHSPAQVTVKAELIKMVANLTVSVLEAEGVFEKGKINGIEFYLFAVIIGNMLIKLCVREGSRETQNLQWLK